jgi:hypothetical protein
MQGNVSIRQHRQAYPNLRRLRVFQPGKGKAAHQIETSHFYSRAVSMMVDLAHSLPPQHIASDLKGLVWGLDNFLHRPFLGSRREEKELMATLESMLSVIRTQGRKWHWTGESPIHLQLVRLQELWTAPLEAHITTQATGAQPVISRQHYSYMDYLPKQYGSQRWNPEYYRENAALVLEPIEELLAQSRGVSSLFDSTVNEFASRPVWRLTLPETMSTCQPDPNGLDSCLVVAPGRVAFRPFAAPQKRYMRSVRKKFLYPPSEGKKPKYIEEEVHWVPEKDCWPVQWHEVKAEKTVWHNWHSWLSWLSWRSWRSN